MSLLSTKPRYFPTAVATERGWVNPQTGEVLVSIGNLKLKLEAETPVEVVTKLEPPVIEIVETKEEIIMETKLETPVKVKREYNKKPKVIGEVVEEKLETNRQIIGEVLEHDLDK
jgi:hypothetical protein